MSLTNEPSGQNPNSPEELATKPELVGETIRKEREARKIPVAVIAADLKLSVANIEALENCNYSALAGDTYARVYLKSIARYLQIDSDALLKRFFLERGLEPIDTLKKDATQKMAVIVRDKEKPGKKLFIALGIILVLSISFLFIPINNSKTSPAITTDQATAVFDSTEKDIPDSLIGETAFDTLIPELPPFDTAQAKIPVSPLRDTMARKTKGKDSSSATKPPAIKVDTTPKEIKEIPAQDSTALSAVPKQADTLRVDHSPGTVMTLQLQIIKDSVWSRVFSDGKAWRNTLRKGQYKSFKAQDSFNLHIGESEAVKLIFNNNVILLPEKGVVTLKIDRSGVSLWNLDKWNTVFNARN